MNLKETLLIDLNEQQKIAVTTTEGYVRVIAGAGSGKTKALTNRYAYIVKALGINPSNILSVTFTKKAAEEMKKRIRDLIDTVSDSGYINTYHGFCARVLREDIHYLKYPKNFIIIDEEDQKLILKDIYDELNIKLKYDTLSKTLRMISYRKLNLEYVRMLSNLNEKITLENVSDLNEKIFLLYLRKQKKVFGLDFDDLINFTFVLFEDYENILDKWQTHLHYIQVDEFQDSSSRQFALIKMLSDKNKNLFVVGDPDQTIYEWRGARPEFLIDFPKIFPSTKTIILNQNYRSTPEVLSVGNALIKKNELRVDKDMFTNNFSGINVIHYHGKSEDEEAKWITDRIKHLTQSGVNLRNIAILYRAHYLSRFIEQGLINASIDYTIYGGYKFFDRREIKDALAYIRLIIYGDDLSFSRVVNVPSRKIGKKRIDFIKQKSEEDGLTLYETLKKYISHEIFVNTDAHSFINVIEDIKQQYENMKVSDLLQVILEKTGYDKLIREDGDQDRLDNLTELFNSITIFEETAGEETTIQDYLEHITLYTDMEKKEVKDSVKLMTIHIAKGLEFPIVFIVGMSESIFPSSRSIIDRKKRGLEEERRLAYVAITRAMKELYLTESEGFSNNGLRKYPSRFLLEIKKELYDRIGDIDENLVIETNDYIEKSNLQITEKSFKNEFIKGERVLHPIFGKGVIEIIDIEKEVYLINFDNNLSKPISFDYSELTIDK